MRARSFALLTALCLLPSIGSAKNAPAPVAGPGQGHGSARFLGTHPIAAPVGGFCYIDVPHTHDYPPDRPALYQQGPEGYVFLGDPVPFGYEGEKTVYYGHHPVPVQAPDVLPASGPGPASRPLGTFCFLKGPHYHDYTPPEGPGYKTQNDVIFYVGPVPPEVAQSRPQVEHALEVEYRPYVAQRPHVVVTPPPEWQGPVWVAPPPTVVVAQPAPSVVVAAPPPVVVAPPAPTVVVAPPAPAIVIGAPMPGVIFVGHGRGHGHGWKHGGGKWKGGKGWKHW